MGEKFAILKRLIRQAWVWMLRNDVFIFLVFVGIATLFWWGRAMSSSRDVNVSFPIIYTDIPSEVVFEQELPNHLNITLRDNGKLLRQVAHTSPVISISLSDRLPDGDGKLVLSADVLRPRIQDILPGSTTIQQIRPEVIESNYHRQAKKCVPVELKASWTMTKQYQLAKAPIITPSEIEIFGKKQLLDNIEKITTDSLYINDLHDTIHTIVSLIIPEGIRSVAKEAKVTFVAEQFTDKTFTLPIQVNNLPAQETIHLFPQEVVVTVRVGISHFAQINEADLQAVCPYPTKGAATLPIEIIHTNPNITQIRTNIREVEYIIER